MTVIDLIMTLIHGTENGKLTGNEHVAVCSVNMRKEIISVTPLSDVGVDKGPGAIHNGMLVLFPYPENELIHPKELIEG